MNKVLILLPETNDFYEVSKLDKTLYDVHLLHASEEVDTRRISVLGYQTFFAQPQFLTSYVDTAVDYVKKNGITAIMYSHDIASVVASVVCEKTGLRGPTLESTFLCLHKYYSRTTYDSGLWFDFISLEESAVTWKNKVRYPCFLKAPFLYNSHGVYIIHTEREMVEALANLKELLSPFFTGFSNFFRKFLNIKKFPLAVQNIVLVEEFVQDGVQYGVDGWVDESGKFTMHCPSQVLFSQAQKNVRLCCIYPQFSLNKPDVEKLLEVCNKICNSFGLRNTFLDVEIWKRGNKFTLIEVNGRIPMLVSEGYSKLFGVRIYEKAVYLACSEMGRLRQHTSPFVYREGKPVFFDVQIQTKGEGIGEDFINYKYAKCGCIKDGVYNNVGLAMTLNFEEESIVKQISTTGEILCNFSISDTSRTALMKRCQQIMNKTVLRSKDLELNQMEEQ